MKALLLVSLLALASCQKYSTSLCTDENRVSPEGLDQTQAIEDGDIFRITAATGVGNYKSQFIRKNGEMKETWPMSVCRVKEKLIAEFTVSDSQKHTHYTAMLLNQADKNYELRSLVLPKTDVITSVGPFKVENHGNTSPDGLWQELDQVILNVGEEAADVLDYLVPDVDTETKQEVVIVLSPIR